VHLIIRPGTTSDQIIRRSSFGRPVRLGLEAEEMVELPVIVAMDVTRFVCECETARSCPVVTEGTFRLQVEDG
jgi:hypothetical protein